VADRVDHSMDAGRLGSAQKRTEVLGILEGIEDQHERRLLALDCPSQDVVEAGELAAVGDQSNPLVAVEARERGQRPTLDLHDRDAQVGRVQDELLESLPPLRDDEQANRRAARYECLFDRAAARDQLFVLTEQVARWRADRRPRRWRHGWTAGLEGSSVDIATGARTVVGAGCPAGWPLGGCILTLDAFGIWRSGYVCPGDCVGRGGDIFNFGHEGRAVEIAGLGGVGRRRSVLGTATAESRTGTPNSRSGAEAGATAWTRTRAPGAEAGATAWTRGPGGSPLATSISRREALLAPAEALVAWPPTLAKSRPRAAIGGTVRSRRTWGPLVPRLPLTPRAATRGTAVAIGGPAFEIGAGSVLPKTAGSWPGDSVPKWSRPGRPRPSWSRLAETEGTGEACGPASARTLESSSTAAFVPTRPARPPKRPRVLETRAFGPRLLEPPPVRSWLLAAGPAPAEVVFPWLVSVIWQVSVRSFGNRMGRLGCGRREKVACLVGAAPALAVARVFNEKASFGQRRSKAV